MTTAHGPTVDGPLCRVMSIYVGPSSGRQSQVPRRTGQSSFEVCYCCTCIIFPLLALSVNVFELRNSIAFVSYTQYCASICVRFYVVMFYTKAYLRTPSGVNKLFLYVDDRCQCVVEQSHFWVNNKYVRLRGLTYIHTCRSYVHTPRDFTNCLSMLMMMMMMKHKFV